MEKKERLLKKEHEFPVFDIISIEITHWKRFGRSIGIEKHILNNIEQNNKGDKYEMVYSCIENKLETSKEEVDWPFWKERLLNLGEGAIVDKIENKYPHFSTGTAEEVHLCFNKEDQVAIVAHNANRKENFLLFHGDLIEEIDLYYGTGELKYCIKMKRENLQEILFEEHKVILQFNKYMFTNNGVLECDILRAAHEWLKDDKGFVIKGYDMKQHLHHYTGACPDIEPYKDSYILVYSANNNVIIHIDTDPVDISKAITNNRIDISYLRTLHHCLVGNAIRFVIVTLCDDTNIAQTAPVLCEFCEKLGLVVTKNIFKNVASLKSWWKSLESKNIGIRNLVNKSKSRADLTEDLLKSIIGFMIGVTSFNVNDFMGSPRFQSTTTKKDKQLVMSHPKIYQNEGNSKST